MRVSQKVLHYKMRQMRGLLGTKRRDFIMKLIIHLFLLSFV